MGYGIPAGASDGCPIVGEELIQLIAIDGHHRAPIFPFDFPCRFETGPILLKSIPQDPSSRLMS